METALQTATTTEAPRPRVFTAFIAVFLLYFAQIVAGTVVILGATIVIIVTEAHLGPGELTPRRMEAFSQIALTRPWVLIASAFAACFVNVAASLLPAAMSRVGIRERLRITAPNLSWKTWAWLLLGSQMVSSASSLLVSITGKDRGGSIELLEKAMQNVHGVQVPLLLLTVGVGAGVGEELFFRGYLQSRFLQRWSMFPAIFLASVFFGIAHMDPAHSVFALLLGLYFGWIAARTGSVLPGIIAHTVNNSLVVLVQGLSQKHERPTPTEMVAPIIFTSIIALIAILVLRKKLPTPSPVGHRA